MIGYLRGTLVESSEDSAILDVGGVGYELSCSQNTLDSWIVGQSIVAYVYTHVREDILQLYGFIDKGEKNLFLSLLKVNGVGPKMAIQILSGCSVSGFYQLIENEDVAGLSRLPKVGKKKAEQMILTLKGKLKFSESEVLISSNKKTITSALINLGFRANDVEVVVSKFSSDMDVQAGIRTALGQLSSVSP